ncbi:MAG TPA: TonB family protein [Pyrinomonadaceae bacterium]|jgi:TonB family protein|nr:TonB family protein [Pyrinomonadaceae bacterium]
MRIRTADAATLAAVLLIAFHDAAGTRTVGAVSRRLREETPTVTLSTRALLKRTVNCRVPVYPVGRGLRAKGVVGVEILIDEGGAVRSAKVVSGHPFLRAEAVRAAMRWTFRPVEVKGKPAKAAGVLRLLFSPDDAEMRRQCARLRPTP